ncbi:MAG TPA: HD domain-containing phosphohydrolase [Egicoccus sp.]|nr:HD domain-containing phosphohydrolase [Egicoccus sp.]HSK21742.1 HD domain-containing phosphohydrolase [Egicoccus sp.]
MRLAEPLAALSVTTDLGMGHGPEKAVRSCLLATELARTTGLAEPQVRDVYYTTLLQHLGCTAPMHELTHLFGNDRDVLARAEGTDESTLRGTLAMMAIAGRGTGVRRARHLVRLVAGGKHADATILRSVCEVGTRMAERLRLGAGVQAGLHDSTETWDGRAGAYGTTGESIAPAARFALLATQAVIFDRLGGPEAALRMVRDRSGRWFDPALAVTFARVGPGLLRRMSESDVWQEVLAVEPRPVKRLPPSRLDEVAAVFGDLADLKSPCTLGHSPAVADLAAKAAARVGLAADRIGLVRRAGLLHDLGRVAVSGGVWARPGPLTAAQWEQVRLHPYYTERILQHSSSLAGSARIASMHHERHDGSGYQRGVGGSAIPVEARLLAAADAFQAMTQERAHRPARSPDEAAARLTADVRTGAFERECVRAVIEAAGQPLVRPLGGHPSGLTDREVEVLRLLARGATNREIATTLVISVRTAEHHVQHIYRKLGTSTRAAAALFAVEHALL